MGYPSVSPSRSRHLTTTVRCRFARGRGTGLPKDYLRVVSRQDAEAAVSARDFVREYCIERGARCALLRRPDRWCRCRLKLQGLPGLLARGGLHRGHAHLLRKRRCLWWRFGLFGFRLPFLAISSLFTLCHGRSPRGLRVGGDGCLDLYFYQHAVL